MGLTEAVRAARVWVAEGGPMRVAAVCRTACGYTWGPFDLWWEMPLVATVDRQGVRW